MRWPLRTTKIRLRVTRIAFAIRRAVHPITGTKRTRALLRTPQREPQEYSRNPIGIYHIPSRVLIFPLYFYHIQILGVSCVGSPYVPLEPFCKLGKERMAFSGVFATFSPILVSSVSRGPIGPQPLNPKA